MNLFDSDTATATCSTHGILATDEFNTDDLKANRHRCRKCVAAGVSRWRQRHPLRVMWMRLVETTKKKLHNMRTMDLTWRGRGKKELIKAMRGGGLAGPDIDIDSLSVEKQEEVRRRYRLKWREGEIVLKQKSKEARW